MERGLLLGVAVGEGVAVLELLAGESSSSLITVSAAVACHPVHFLLVVQLVPRRGRRHRLRVRTKLTGFICSAPGSVGGQLLERDRNTSTPEVHCTRMPKIECAFPPPIRQFVEIFQIQIMVQHDIPRPADRWGDGRAVPINPALVRELFVPEVAKAIPSRRLLACEAAADCKPGGAMERAWPWKGAGP